MQRQDGRHLAAIMIADVVGYSRLMERDEASTHARLRALRAAILEPQFAAHGGILHHVAGDGFLVEFPSALAALRCGIDIQRAFAGEAEDVPAVDRIALRIGINVGDIIVDRGEIAGNGVNVAARLETLCQPGNICISAAVRDQIHDDLGVTFVDMGRQAVKNIQQPVQVYRVEPQPLPAGRLKHWIRSTRRKPGTRRLLIGAALVAVGGIAAIVAVPLYMGSTNRSVDLPPLSAEEAARRSAEMPRRPNSLAVLPLANFSKSSDEEFFADGITEALIADLAKIEAVHVISRTSVMRFKKRQDKSLPEIARELNVDTIVEGSVQRANGKVIITANLIRAATDEHLWANRFERNIAEVASLQTEVARAIAEHINIKFTAQDDARLTTKQIVNPAAYEAYLKGRFLAHKWQVAPALEQFQEAMRIQPDYAPAYASLAQTYMLAPGLLKLTNLQARAKALPAAERALELDPKAADAYLALASVHGPIDYDWATSEREMKYAIGLNPGLAGGYAQYGVFLGMIGRIDEGIALLKRARELEPLSSDINGALGRLYYYAQRYPEAVRRLGEALNADPEIWIARVYLAGTYVQQGKYAEARDQVEKLPKWFPELPGSLAYVDAASGRREKARSELSAILSDGKRPSVSSWTIAGVYAALGDNDQAFAWLDKAYEERFVILPSLSVSPVFQPLRKDPRFVALLTKMNLSPTERRPAS